MLQDLAEISNIDHVQNSTTTLYSCAWPLSLTIATSTCTMRWSNQEHESWGGGRGGIRGFQTQTHPPLKNSNLLNSHSKLTENSPGLRPPQAHWQTQLFLSPPPTPLNKFFWIHLCIWITYMYIYMYHLYVYYTTDWMTHQGTNYGKTFNLFTTNLNHKTADTLYVNLNDVIQKNLLAATQIKIFIHHLSIF